MSLLVCIYIYSSLLISTQYIYSVLYSECEVKLSWWVSPIRLSPSGPPSQRPTVYLHLKFSTIVSRNRQTQTMASYASASEALAQEQQPSAPQGRWADRYRGVSWSICTTAIPEGHDKAS